MKDCSGLTDTSLLTLSKHQPQADAFCDSDADSEEDDEKPQDLDPSPATLPSSSTRAVRGAQTAAQATAVAHSSHVGGEGAPSAGAGSRAKRAVVHAVDRVVAERAQAREGVASSGPASGASPGSSGWREQRAERGVRRVVLDGCRKITSRGVQVCFAVLPLLTPPAPLPRRAVHVNVLPMGGLEVGHHFARLYAYSGAHWGEVVKEGGRIGVLPP